MKCQKSGIDKEKLVALHKKGQPVSLLCATYRVPKSTMYYWIRQNTLLKSSTGNSVSYQEYANLKRYADRLERQLEVIQAAGCGTGASLQEKLEALEKLHGKYSVHTLCDALGVSRGTYYNHVFRRKDITFNDRRREEMRVHVQEVFDESKQRFGAKKIRAVLAERGIRVSDRYVLDLMREMELHSIGSCAKHEYKKRGRREREDHLRQQFSVTKPNHVWVSDVTCYKLKNIHYFICIIIDLFSRKVIAHSISRKHSTNLITTAFKRAFVQRACPQQLTFHSDQGIQYMSRTFRNLLQLNNVVQSFSRSGRPHDNAVAESFFSSLKKEELYRTDYRSEKELRIGVETYVQFYNSERPHGTLGYKTPDGFEAQFGK